MVLSGPLLTALLLSGTALAGPSTTSDALERLEEVLALRVEDGLLDPAALMPALLVSVQPRYETSAPWFATRAIEALERALGPGDLRLCEACMAPRVYAAGGALTYQTGPAALDEIARLDDRTRGDAQPARAAIWVDEYRGGVSVRIVDLHTGRVLFAQNIDPSLAEGASTQRSYTRSEELERRARGDSITQTFIDFALYPGQHIAIDWTEQWGPTNANLTGVTLSLVDPVVGLGACHYRATGLYDVLVGAKLIVSLPTAVVESLGDDGDEVIDPLLTAVGVARVPFGRSNYGAVLTVSTNGEVGIGVTLMNIRLLQVLP